MYPQTPRLLHTEFLIQVSSLEYQQACGKPNSSDQVLQLRLPRRARRLARNTFGQVATAGFAGQLS